MLVSDFNFDLPKELIADKPKFPRDTSRLLVVDNQLTDKTFSDIIDLLNPDDVLVFNDTKVIPARLFGNRAGAKVEVTLHKNEADGVWKVFAKPAKKLKTADIFYVADDFYATVLDKNEGEVTLKFSTNGEEFFDKLNKYGQMPLPPYIDRKDGTLNSDIKDYQTVYAKNKGAVAAPTAGLHFTDELLRKIDEKGVKRVFTTLHVGAGTFLPVKVDDTKDHKMHSEFGIVTKDAANAINESRKSGGRVICVGTTSLRILESVADDEGNLSEFEGETDIFITPGYKFKIADCLLTNFHIPKSTLFMLVSAFSGLERMQDAYRHAISQNYRFYSYGDACFLNRFGM
ncbi:MAG: tRNA preQ1(34) S-adenosylmethionine ribosyltransferase-isomerase QueA [Rickettsiales bacterium]|nr:tRNA preQ1(34) S-adenosylmethionine ribosyltransferase-isomerase QueA [Pseudomonadota bacterium]MDA0967261.1 tRNA preQ1(34) S-adenosylmethionine ribosyltransferase-isomerase QueA [Pseudomonadota bacterium]MDG4544078.1 tRNA preQ1(34) S-adenosylmethionine ribosyltransferase-isomerase QueA [Rickettsiales bacterium]MDG4546228.1 tRNA preQ1(34) S-adenosylmethionine ribosyltransferase-isomerase QueA [Rickettsiales bacterium]MDG4548402.1 tRNA preQ1(34) S-adenosylmethionine ribosyltransferase-isomera